jgi:hypothetical protein
MLTVSAAAGLSGLCVAYTALTRPLLRPAERVDRGPIEFSSEPITTPESEIAKRYLPDQPWAAKPSDYVIRNGRSLVFFNRYEPVENNTAVRIEPFAMIFPPSDEKPDAEPLTIVGEAAILRVAGSIELTNADPGRIVGASVPGPVRLRGPEGLDLQGHNFTYDENAQRLWSDDDVTFRHAEHSGRGRGIQLDLLRVGDPEAFESIAVSGVRVLRLLSHVEMDLRIDDERGGGPFGAVSTEPKNITAAADAAAATKAPVPPTHVTCQGSFTFDLDRNVAAFEERVVASRPVPGGAADSLECDSLEVWFEPSTDEAKLAASMRRQKIAAGTLTEDDGFQAIDEKLGVKWLVASGQNVMLRSPTNEFVASLTNLAYDAATGATNLSREGGEVIAHQGSSVLRSPVISLVPAKDKSPPTVVCTGQGNLRHFNEQGMLELEASWSKHLHRMRAESGLDLIRLTGLAVVEQPKESFRLDADGIDLWLDPKKNETNVKPAAGAFAASGRMEPVRLIATAAQTPKSLVMLRSPELEADAKKLDVTFVSVPSPTTTAAKSRSDLRPTAGHMRLASAERASGPPPAPPPEPRTLEEPATARPLPPSGSPATTTAAPPAAAIAPAAIPPAAIPPVVAAEASAPREPLKLEAEVINVVVARRSAATTAEAGQSVADRGGEVREVHTTGGVIVQQKRSGSDDPLSIYGDRLDLFNRGKDQELIHIYGRPASVAADGTEIEATPAQVHDGEADLYGMNVNLDRRENRAWVEGRGVLLLPAKGATGMLGLEGEAPQVPPEVAAEPAEPQRLQVFWMERMDFEGETAHFFGDVQTKMQEDVMTCQEMEVRLTERFDFASAGKSDRSKPSSRPEVAEVICKTGVRVDGEEHKDGKLVSVRQAKFFEFHFDQRTGATHAIGPGQIEMWKVGDGNRASFTSDNAVRANTSRQPANESWEYLFVRFDGTSDGNVRQRTTTFHDRVRIVYGPVAGRKQTIDPDRVDLGPVEGGWMKCDQLTLTQHAKTDTATAYSEVLGEGDVQIHGRGFSGVADQVMYDESKGQYILKSFDHRNAIVGYDKPDGTGRGETSAREILGFPARMFWHAANVSEFNGSQ